eukprot:3809548-Rhodomonas_salina.1
MGGGSWRAECKSPGLPARLCCHCHGLRGRGAGWRETQNRKLSSVCSEDRLQTPEHHVRGFWIQSMSPATEGLNSKSVLCWIHLT